MKLLKRGGQEWSSRKGVLFSCSQLQKERGRGDTQGNGLIDSSLTATGMRVWWWILESQDESPVGMVEDRNMKMCLRSQGPWRVSPQ